ncbi:MAG: hypothetical protein AAFV95_05570 [Bacteroidota bacterium]
MSPYQSSLFYYCGSMLLFSFGYLTQAVMQDSWKEDSMNGFCVLSLMIALSMIFFIDLLIRQMEVAMIWKWGLQLVTIGLCLLVHFQLVRPVLL